MKKRGTWILAAVLILAGLGFGGMALRSYLEEQHAGEEYEELKAAVAVTTQEPSEEPEATQEAAQESQTDTEEESSDEAAVGEDTAAEIPVDFDALTAQYPDVYAWITVPGTKIDYPVAQRAGDNSYYLTHTLDGDTKTEGAIFTEDYNSTDFTDPHTVIYGHNMRNGSMFQNLHNFEDREFFNEHREILVYLPDEILHYQIFAAYVYDNSHLLTTVDTKDPDTFESYLESVLALKSMGNNIDDSVALDGDSKILTLSTCNSNSEERYLVQSVLISIDSLQ